MVKRCLKCNKKITPTPQRQPDGSVIYIDKLTCTPCWYGFQVRGRVAPVWNEVKRGKRKINKEANQFSFRKR